MAVRMAAHPVPGTGWNSSGVHAICCKRRPTDFISDEWDQHQILTNIFIQSFTFLPRNNPLEVSFDLYDENHQIPLTEFCDICLIPSDGSLAEPRPAEFETFYAP